LLAKLPQLAGDQKNVSTIDIHAFHTLSHEEALNAADELSIDLAKKFGIDYGWEDEVINFERPGVNGQIQVKETELRIQADLGFLLMMDYGWEDEVINFERPGVNGQIQVKETELRIQADLGFLLMMLKGPIEQEIVRYLKEHFGCSFDTV